MADLGGGEAVIKQEGEVEMSSPGAEKLSPLWHSLLPKLGDVEGEKREARKAPEGRLALPMLSTHPVWSGQALRLPYAYPCPGPQRGLGVGQAEGWAQSSSRGHPLSLG